MGTDDDDAPLPVEAPNLGGREMRHRSVRQTARVAAPPSSVVVSACIVADEEVRWDDQRIIQAIPARRVGLAPPDDDHVAAWINRRLTAGTVGADAHHTRNVASAPPDAETSSGLPPPK